MALSPVMQEESPVQLVLEGLSVSVPGLDAERVCNVHGNQALPCIIHLHVLQTQLEVWRAAVMSLTNSRFLFPQ